MLSLLTPEQELRYKELEMKLAGEHSDDTDSSINSAVRDKIVDQESKLEKLSLDKELQDVSTKFKEAKRSIEHRIKEEVERIQSELESILKTSYEDAWSFVIQQRSVYDFEFSESTKFFICKRQECPGAACIMCSKALKKENISDHCCSFDELEELYENVLKVLAKASSQSCPKCNFSGMKDLACTHITCPSCNTRWCYCCGKSEAAVNGFSEHNKWDPKSSQDKCPMYLPDKYGDLENPENGKRMGDASKALKAFHLELQLAVIEKLKSETSSDLWDRMMRVKFPKGIFVKDAFEDVETKHS
jgi:hypothetical protein